ncbi:MAG: hypothetical protein L3J12_04390 [Spirochaetales bacterium]|nr:hypothetical protein [Spirochaetales bacterium]
MIRILRSLPLLITLFLFSCGNSNLLMTLSDSENSVIFRSSVSEGGIVDPESGETIDISMEYDEDIVRPVKLEIAFLNAQGMEISDPEIIEGEALNEPLPSLSIDTPGQDIYTLRLRVFDDSDFLIKEEKIPFFYSSATLGIRDMKTYPNSFIPGGDGLVLANVTADESTWARWTIDSEIIEEGLISDYRDGFIWRAPPVEGVYSLRLELFPVRPVFTINGTFPFDSTIKSEVAVYVSSSVIPDSSDLYPKDSYSTLLHFNGLIKDVGTDPGNLSSVGTPLIRREGDKFGIYLDGSSGYTIEGNILPFEDNKLMPFSVTFSYFLREPQPERSFLDISNIDEHFFAIKTDSSGVLFAELSQTGGTLKDLSGMLSEDYSELTVSVIPGAGNVSINWYGDGMLLSSGVYSYNPPEDSEGFNSLIGGSLGFKGLIDEFGIYVRDEEGRANIDSNIFNRRVSRRYNPDKVIAAMGFDDLNYSNGVYEISPGDEFEFVETDFNFSHLYIDIDFMDISDGTEIHINFSGEDDIESLHINLADIIPAPEINQNLELELANEDGAFSVNYMGNPIAKVNLKVESSAVFNIINNSESDVLRVSSILVRREEKRIVEDNLQIINEKL